MKRANHTHVHTELPFHIIGDQFGNALYERADASNGNGREVGDLRAAVLALGRQLGLDEATTRQQVVRKAGRPLGELEPAELARVLRAMAEALGRGQRAA